MVFIQEPDDIGVELPGCLALHETLDEGEGFPIARKIEKMRVGRLGDFPQFEGYLDNDAELPLGGDESTGIRGRRG